MTSMTDDELRQRFLYPNGTLKNKLNLQDAETLSTVEYQMVAYNAAWLLGHGYVIKSMDDFAKLHRFLFGDLYSWAGQFRDYYLAKGGTELLMHLRSQPLCSTPNCLTRLITCTPSGKGMVAQPGYLFSWLLPTMPNILITTIKTVRLLPL